MFFSSVTCFTTFPLGFFHDKVGVGAPFASHVNLTVCPIQDSDFTGETVSIVAASVKYNHANNQRPRILLKENVTISNASCVNTPYLIY